MARQALRSTAKTRCSAPRRKCGSSATAISTRSAPYASSRRGSPTSSPPGHSCKHRTPTIALPFLKRFPSRKRPLDSTTSSVGAYYKHMPSQTLFVLRNIYALIGDLFPRIKILFSSFPEKTEKSFIVLHFAVDNVSLFCLFFYRFRQCVPEVGIKVLDYFLYVYGYFSHLVILTPSNHSPNAQAAPRGAARVIPWRRKFSSPSRMRTRLRLPCCSQHPSIRRP